MLVCVVGWDSSLCRLHFRPCAWFGQLLALLGSVVGLWNHRFLTSLVLHAAGAPISGVQVRLELAQVVKHVLHETIAVSRMQYSCTVKASRRAMFYIMFYIVRRVICVVGEVMSGSISAVRATVGFALLSHCAEISCSKAWTPLHCSYKLSFQTSE